MTVGRHRGGAAVGATTILVEHPYSWAATSSAPHPRTCPRSPCFRRAGGRQGLGALAATVSTHPRTSHSALKGRSGLGCAGSPGGHREGEDLRRWRRPRRHRTARRRTLTSPVSPPTRRSCDRPASTITSRSPTILEIVTDRPISFEVFSDDLGEMERQALRIRQVADNVNVKIPVTNRRASAPTVLLKRLVERARWSMSPRCFTVEQVEVGGECTRQRP